jgi:hypothetical protein
LVILGADKVYFEHREFATGQVERACAQGAAPQESFACPVGAQHLAFDSQAFVIYDGHALRTRPDAAAAIAAVLRSRRWCSAIDLSATRTGTAG